MLLLAAAAIMTAPPANAPRSQFAAPAACPRTSSYRAWQRGKSVKPQKLTELLDANLYLTVYRRVAGCEEPIIVKYGVSNR